MIFDIGPSAVSRGLIWVGTDDGLVRVTHDGGAHWRNVTPPGVPAWGRIDDVDPSARDTNTAYVAVDLHRLDRMEPMAFRTHDGGRSWTRIDRGLPANEYVAVVRADPVRRGLLFAGTNRGVYVSFDDGEAWQPLRVNFPTTWVRDLLIHDGDLIAATQGRGIWILDDLAPLRELSSTIVSAPAHLFRPAAAIRLRENENRDTPWPPSTPVAQNPPTGAVVDYWLRDSVTGPVTLTFRDSTGHTVRRFSSNDAPESLPGDRYFQIGWIGTPQRVAPGAGAHRFVWDLRAPRPAALSYQYSIAAIWQVGTPLEPRGPLVLPGRYTVTLTAGRDSETTAFTVRLDPRVTVTPAALVAQWSLLRTMDAVLDSTTALHDRIDADSSRAARRGVSADSLRAIDGALTDAAGTLAGLVTAVGSADAAPTAGDLAAFDSSRAAADAARARWLRVTGSRP